MNIFIDSTQIPIGRTGVGIYAEQLIHHLALCLNPEDKLFVLTQSDDLALREMMAAHANISPILIPASLFRNRLLLAIYEQCMLPWVAIYHSIDLVHSLHYTFPLLCSRPRAVTIHDMTHFLWPEMHTFGRRKVMSLFGRLALRYAEGILFVSESTRRDAEQILGTGNNIRKVTPLAVDYERFSNIHPEKIDETLSRLNVSRPYILFLGTLEPRKNLVRLIHAFERLDQKYWDYTLVIAGKLGWDYATTLEAIEKSPRKERIQRIGYVAPEDKAPLISGSDILVYPSLYEGFGLPALEGMAAGVPVITSNLSSLPEVAGNAAVLIDPASVEQLVEAMNFLVSDDTYRSLLRISGREQARQFSWERTARLTYAAYAEILARSKAQLGGQT